MTSNSVSLYITQIRFCRALAVVRSLPKDSGVIATTSISEKVNFYGLYKQALEGDCMLLRPSSKNIVQYTKWKAWDKLRGISPIEAQMMYINALIQLLKQFIKQYPESELTESLIQSINYLEETAEDGDNKEDEDLVQWDTNDQENEDYYLGEIEKEQILSDNHYNYSYLSSPITSEFPLTPELVPKYSHYKRSIPSSISSLQHHHHYNYSQFEEFSNKDYTTSPSIILSDQNSSHHRKRHHSNSSSKKAAIQTLQLEVAALCEEIDQLRKREMTKTTSIFKWRWLWLIKSIAKHAFFNFLILVMLFIVLWRRRSPIAYAVISYAGPKLKDFMQYLFSRIVYWRVAV